MELPAIPPLGLLADAGGVASYDAERLTAGFVRYRRAGFAVVALTPALIVAVITNVGRG